MPPTALLIFVLVLLLVPLAAYAASRPRTTSMKILLTLALLPFLLFSAYGFLATFEPGPGAIPWRVVYSVGALAAAAGIWKAWLGAAD
jgi:hypothetical protein